MQNMRNRAINRVYVRVCQHFLVIRRALTHGRHVVAEPIHQCCIGVAHSNDFRARLSVAQVQPAGRCTCKFASHQAAADNAEAENLRHNVPPFVTARLAEMARRFLCSCTIVDDCHQRLRHALGVAVLNNVTAIDNAARTLLHQRSGS
ncbi:hypothetical protein D3C80_1247540 [compost metagenome]